MHIVIINGPNLNLLGKRETDIYGTQSFDDYLVPLRSKYQQHELEYFQSNHEGEIIDKIHEVGFNCDGIIYNGGGFTHSSIAIRDAFSAVPCQMVEVHISNIYARESFRHHSYSAAVAKGIISGLGIHGYDLAIQYFETSQSNS